MYVCNVYIKEAQHQGRRPPLARIVPLDAAGVRWARALGRPDCGAPSGAWPRAGARGGARAGARGGWRLAWRRRALRSGPRVQRGRAATGQGSLRAERYRRQHSGHSAGRRAKGAGRRAQGGIAHRGAATAGAPSRTAEPNHRAAARRPRRARRPAPRPGAVSPACRRGQPWG